MTLGADAIRSDITRPDIREAASRLSPGHDVGRELRQLDALLRDEEMVFRLAAGMYGNGSGLLAVTSRRVLLLRDGQHGHASEGFPLDRLVSALWLPGLDRGTISVSDGHSAADLTQVEDGTGPDVVRLIRSLMPPAPAEIPLPVAEDGFTAQPGPAAFGLGHEPTAASGLAGILSDGGPGAGLPGHALDAGHVLDADPAFDAGHVPPTGTNGFRSTGAAPDGAHSDGAHSNGAHANGAHASGTHGLGGPVNGSLASQTRANGSYQHGPLDGRPVAGREFDVAPGPVAAPHDAGPARYGAAPRGTATNGTATNGTAVNGTAARGPALNGSGGRGSAPPAPTAHAPAPGGSIGAATATSGTPVTSLVSSSSAFQGTHANGSMANGSMANGSMANGSARNGVHANGSMANGSGAGSAWESAPSFHDRATGSTATSTATRGGRFAVPMTVRTSRDTRETPGATQSGHMPEQKTAAYANGVRSATGALAREHRSDANGPGPSDRDYSRGGFADPRANEATGSAGGTFVGEVSVSKLAEETGGTRAASASPFAELSGRDDDASGDTALMAATRDPLATGSRRERRGRGRTGFDITGDQRSRAATLLQGRNRWIVGGAAAAVLLSGVATVAVVSTHKSSTTEAAPAADPAGLVVRVSKVIDGDSIEVEGPYTGQVEVVGITAPRTDREQCGSIDSAGFATRTLGGSTVTLVSDPAQPETDKAGRRLASVRTPNGDYAVLAAEAGMARYYQGGGAVSQAEDIKAAQAQAETAKRGIWGSPCNGRLGGSGASALRSKSASTSTRSTSRNRSNTSTGSESSSSTGSDG